MKEWMVSKHMDLGTMGDFYVERIICTPDNGQVVRAVYLGTYLRADGEKGPAIIEAHFTDAVVDDVDAILHAGWEEWSIEEV